MAFEASRIPRYDRPPIIEEDPPVSAPPPHVVAISIDAFADAALARVRDGAATGEVRCDACDMVVDDEPWGRGVFVTTRGEEVRYEEPVLCASCATAICLRAKKDFEIEEEG